MIIKMSNNTEPLDNLSLAIIFQLYIFAVWFSLEIIQVCSHLNNFSPSFAPFNGPFFCWPLYGPRNRLIALKRILSVIQPITIYTISGGSKGGPGDASPLPGGPNSFNFMQFLGKFDKFVCWRPPGSWHPLLGEIPDPPLTMLNKSSPF